MPPNDLPMATHNNNSNIATTSSTSLLPSSPLTNSNTSSPASSPSSSLSPPNSPHSLTPTMTPTTNQSYPLLIHPHTTTMVSPPFHPPLDTTHAMPLHPHITTPSTTPAPSPSMLGPVLVLALLRLRAPIHPRRSCTNGPTQARQRELSIPSTAWRPSTRDSHSTTPPIHLGPPSLSSLHTLSQCLAPGVLPPDPRQPWNRRLWQSRHTRRWWISPKDIGADPAQDAAAKQ
jgi:hypothetical protein